MARGASSAEVLAAVRRPLEADFMPLPPSVWRDPHPPMAFEPIPSILADLGEVSDYAPTPLSTWGPPVKSPAVAIDDSDYMPVPRSVWG